MSNIRAPFVYNEPDDREDSPIIFFSSELSEHVLYNVSKVNGGRGRKTKKNSGSDGISKSSKDVVNEESVRPMEAYIRQTDEMIAKLWDDIKEREKTDDK